MPLNFFRLSCLLGLGALLAGCGDLDDPEAARRDSEPVFDWRAVERNQKSAQSAARAQNEFGLKLLRIVAAQNPDENTFVSPTSVWMALAMAKNGADGATRRELKRVLEWPNEADAPVRALRATLAAQGAKINLANAIWADKKTPFAPIFVTNSAQTFGAAAQTLDFRAPDAVATINQWVEQQTEGEISELMRELPDSGAVLTNALYFRGRWQTPFETSDTKAAPFHLPNGTEKSVPLMARADFQGVKGAGFVGAILPYANSSCELLALLPLQGKTPLDVARALNAAKLEKIRPSFSAEVKLPRFSLDWDGSLVAPLQTLGLQTAFEREKADLRPMGLPPGSYFFAVHHKTRLEIDEAGTVAAAATDVDANSASEVSEDEPKILVFDRPFLLLLRETHSGAILFAGIINDPKKG